MKLPNVEGCYIGRKMKRGRAQSRLAVICCVASKVPKRSLASTDRVPARLEWPRTRSRKFRMVTDVQPIAGTELQQAAAVVGPGDRLESGAGNAPATIGIAIKHPGLGIVVTTAGHAFMANAGGTIEFPPGMPRVRIANAGSAHPATTFEAVPLKAVRVAEADYALLRPTAEARNLFHDRVNLSAPHWAIPEDEGTPLFALRRERSQPTVLRGTAGAFTFGGVAMRGLLLTDEVTVGGDSGCCLVDTTSRVWGLLVGVALVGAQRRSVFASPSWVLAMEQAEMA
jgi:hypothetical protein